MSVRVDMRSAAGRRSVRSLAYTALLGHQRTERAVDWVIHTKEAIREAEHIERLMVDLEIGQRGFLVTGDELFLEPYHAAKQKLDFRLSGLRKEVSDNPPQVRRIDDTALLVSRWHSEIGGPEIALRRTTNAETFLKQVDMTRGKTLVDAIRAELADFIRAEEQLLTTRRATSTEMRAKTRDAILLGSILTLVLTLALSVGADQSSRARTKTTTGPEGVLHGRVLIVEDNSVNQLIARRFLKKLGCEYEVAENGARALELLRKDEYDVVLMDCQMPVMDGYEATRRIRSGETGRPDQPIIAVTASAMKGDNTRCTEAGMNAYLTKPIEVEALEAELSHWLSVPIEAPVSS